MNVNDLFPSRFLKAHDLAGKPYTLTIRAVSLEDVGHGGEAESKLAIAFEKATKMMLLNRTNAMIIASLYGPETDQWLGKSVTIYSARVKAFGAWHDALRIKEQIPARNIGAEKMTEAMQEQPPIDDENDLLDVDEDGPVPSADESLWEPNAPVSSKKPDGVSQAQLARLAVLVTDVYGSAAKEQEAELAQAVSKGAVSRFKDLVQKEAQVAIGTLEKKLKDRQSEREAA
jgi:hypothetical protein